MCRSRNRLLFIFLTPVVPVRLRGRMVHPAPVPEAPINEDCDFRAAEDEISSPPDFNKWARRDTVTHTHGMNRTSHSHLRLGVS